VNKMLALVQILSTCAHIHHFVHWAWTGRKYYEVARSGRVFKFSPLLSLLLLSRFKYHL